VEDVPVAYLFLAGAIVAEVIATSFLRLVTGDRQVPWAYAVVVVGYVASFVLLAQALNRGMPVGVAYAIWSAVGIVLIALIGRIAFAERLSAVQLIGIALIVVGVGLVEIGGSAEARA
jgi:small multidrug resistance pump